MLRPISISIYIYIYASLVIVIYLGYSNPITGLVRPIRFQEVEAPRFQDSRHMKW
jgi:hypothetical protein